MGLWWLGVVCGTGMALAACGEKVCTLRACGEALRVTFVPSDMWRPGDYRIEVTADGRTSSCDVTLPLQCGRAARCEGEVDWVTVDSGCTAPVDQHAIQGLTFLNRAPAELTVTVFMHDLVLGEASFRPQYSVVRPNGDECEPSCKVAPTPGTMPVQMPGA